jgi:hypothetical protein
MHFFTFAAALAILQQPQVAATNPVLDDLRTLTVAQDNDGRFDAVTALLRARNLAFTVEPFTIEKPAGAEPRTQGRNVVLSLGSGSEEIVVGAHYDAKRIPGGSLSAGAVDNGASAVMLIRMAEALRSEVLPVRVRFVWFDMEELGLIGSDRYVAAHGSDHVAAMLNFDINAYGDTVLFGPPAGGDNGRLKHAALQTCVDEGIDCLRFAGLPPGDDRSFGKAGVPTLSVATLPGAEAHQLWLMLHAGAGSGLAPGTTPAILKTIHTADDVIARVDGATIERAQRFAVALVRQIARTASGPSTQQSPKQDDAHPARHEGQHEAMMSRGAQAMGFDQQRTVHHFLLYEDGGAVEISVKESGDRASLRAVRQHLQEIATLFKAGDFDKPAMTHGRQVPGTAEMTRLKNRITYRYAETPSGGRVRIVTRDADALAAVHAFLRFQIEEHHTGDSATPQR